MFAITAFVLTSLLLIITENVIYVDQTAIVYACIVFTTVGICADLRFSKSLYEFSGAILTGYLWRLALLFFDIYGREIYGLPNSGADTEGFYYESVHNAISFNVIEDPLSFDGLMGTIFSIVGTTSRLYGQYIIMLFSLIAIVFFAKCLLKLNIDVIVRRRAMYIVCLLPNFAILSSIFLRESVVCMFITISLFCFVIWMTEGKELFFILAFVFSFVGSIFHAGAAGAALGYVAVRLIYDNKSNKLKLGFKTILPAIIFMMVFAYIYLNYGETFFDKINGTDSISDVANTNEDGGSSYAAYVGNSSNPISMIVYTIPRIAFFLFSPFPWQWRGLADIIAFVFSSMFYLFAIVDAIKCIKNNATGNRTQVILICIVAFCIVFIFGWGTANTGTAARHRDKAILIYGLMYALAHNKNSGFKISLGQNRVF